MELSKHKKRMLEQVEIEIYKMHGTGGDFISDMRRIGAILRMY